MSTARSTTVDQENQGWEEVARVRVRKSKDDARKASADTAQPSTPVKKPAQHTAPGAPVKAAKPDSARRNPGSKYDDAKKLGIKIIGEQEFLGSILS